MDAYRAAFALRVADGTLRPLVLPYFSYGFILLGIYLCIPHTKSPWLYAARWPVLVVIVAFQWKIMWEVTSMSMAMGFACGLFSAWGIAWSFTWLVWNKPQFDAKRVQRGKEKSAEDVTAVGDGLRVNGSATTDKTYDKAIEANRSSSIHAGEDLRHRIHQNGDSKAGKTNGELALKKIRYISEPEASDILRSIKGTIDYYWQGYPDNLRERIPWVCDLLMNFRGPGWNWAILPLPALPPQIKATLGGTIDAASWTGISSVGLRRFNTRREVFVKQMPYFVIGYFLLDILKVVMMKDPYYIFGPNTYALPPHLQGYSLLALRFIRQVISTLSIVISLEMVFKLCPLGFCLLLGPKVLGLRGEAWYYPTTWGSWGRVMDHGLNGLWGSWWHQTFRFAFSAPSNFLIDNGYVHPHSFVARVLAMIFAFGISGILHSAGSVSQFPHTHPWHALAFFMLQAVGVVVQLTICSILHPYIKKLPRSVRQAGNFLYAFFWLFETGWLLTDDFARGGMWLYEPIPISPLRGLGFGEKGDGWWCWDYKWIGLYSRKHWWESGIAF
jgi:hypothetical protein